MQIAEIEPEGRGFDSRTQRTVVDHQRTLDFVKGVHVTRFGAPGRRVPREVFAGRSADAMVFRYTSDGSRGLQTTLTALRGPATFNDLALTFVGSRS